MFYFPIQVFSGVSPVTPETWTDVLQVYGIAAPFALLLLWLVWEYRKDIKEKESEIKRLSESAIEKLVPLVVEGTKSLAEAVAVLNDVDSRRKVDQEKFTHLINKAERTVKDLEYTLEKKKQS